MLNIHLKVRMFLTIICIFDEAWIVQDSKTWMLYNQIVFDEQLSASV